MWKRGDVFAVIILLFFILPFMCFPRPVIWRNAGTNPGIKTDLFYFSWGGGTRVPSAFVNL